MQVRTNRLAPLFISAAFVLHSALPDGSVGSSADTVRGAGGSASEPARDENGWMPDVAARLARLSADREAALDAHADAVERGHESSPWWWQPSAAPDEAQP